MTHALKLTGNMIRDLNIITHPRAIGYVCRIIDLTFSKSFSNVISFNFSI